MMTSQEPDLKAAGQPTAHAPTGNVPTRAEIMSALVCAWAFDQSGACDAEAEGACAACKMRERLMNLDGFEVKRPESVTTPVGSRPKRVSPKPVSRARMTRNERAV